MADEDTLKEPIFDAVDRVPGTGAAAPVDRAGENVDRIDLAARSDVLRRQYLLRRYWLGARGFWLRGGDRHAWPLTFGVFGLVLLILAAQYGMNLWNRLIFDALENRDAQSVLFYAAAFLPLVAVSVGFGVASVYVRMTIQRRWRAWINRRLINRWLTHGRYYQLNLVGGEHVNPEYRIAQDLRTASDAPVDFSVGLLSAILSAITFIAVLWTIGGSFSVDLGFGAFEVPGYLVIAAVVYAALASGLMALIGRRFVEVTEAVADAEADYRYELTRVRENGESIALLGGEVEERAGLERSFRVLLREWRDLCGQHMRTTVVSHASGLLAPVVPVILCAPKFLDDTMSLGTIMQAASAFTIVQGAFGWLVDNYARLAEWSASARRVASLMVSLDTLERAETGQGPGRIQRGETSDVALRLRNLSVTLDDGTAVIGDAEVSIRPGERVLVTGESGVGKSVLVRAIAGLWPWGEGSIEIKTGASLFMLPQQPYIPIGSLRHAAAYPSPADRWSLGKIGEAMENCGLGHLIDRLEEEGPWGQTLSAGDKQRLAFVRLFLHRPDIIVFHEATSALDPASQDVLMELVCTTLSEATVISVGQRPELEAFHGRKIVLERRAGTAHFVADIPLVNALPRHKLHRWLHHRRAQRARKRAERARS